MSDDVKRSYNSALRREQAEATRLRIIRSARTLFLERGFAKTSVPAIAAAAEVSADTIYHVFTNKRTLLEQLVGLDIGGDEDPTPIMERPPALAVRDAADQRTQIHLFAAGIAQQVARIRPVDDILIGAAAVDSSIAELRSDIQDRQRRSAMTRIASWIAERGPLAVDIETAGTTIWSLTSPEMHRMLCDRSGWSTDRYAHWLTHTLTSVLLGEPSS
ncbi:TetR/AcrR family transcriptional regulator [Rhodococcoides yunnanense]|uniref:TetR/AcrR family transcriptional regulator n=1 Tax=Rhodococcoides yunnanense TaxID=278209 RepID=UPI0014738613|nr:TetR/AcrR family transcriptional regulator [Rhodococcus yunnanensis]